MPLLQNKRQFRDSLTNYPWAPWPGQKSGEPWLRGRDPLPLGRRRTVHACSCNSKIACRSFSIKSPLPLEQSQARLVLLSARSLPTFLRLQRHLVAFPQPLQAARPSLLRGHWNPSDAWTNAISAPAISSKHTKPSLSSEETLEQVTTGRPYAPSFERKPKKCCSASHQKDQCIAQAPTITQHSSGTYNHPAITHAGSLSGGSTPQGKCQGCHLINSTQAWRERSKRC